VYNKKRNGQCCITQLLPFRKGKSSAGAFSLAVAKTSPSSMYSVMAVGGDYLNDTSTYRNSFYFTVDGARNYGGYVDTKGYKSCVELLDETKQSAIATGTSGTDLYADMVWKPLSPEAFHVVRKAKKGKAVFLAGPKGTIGKLVGN
jgi:hypothetical protein